ncbi:cytochrome o ubiquinol oxidase subunit 3 [Paenibacillus cellulosilyticus]|uniref:Cytochrome bo(3) ubiquinol oxidase subunit 3 n=1 Tax=Paenibacillus cellulosilyticus TaxID=375489 RepID=A0A2V2Z145_9BACL|nr:cytochrome o ubiquinol oxidase subunit III [Paenibacillus cellulosilyticus]PWW08522.1 cytochrome o ubiquinol oxidase subunit 3 [Paenibacillus cellulosilyticus]QKS48101.1 cytochrome o ubiquinol oxidase subunit III [Paenibacillus cellulosilyticus]
MANSVSHKAEQHGHDHGHHHHDLESLKTFGFWIFLMTDVIIFGTLFAVYAVLRNNTAGGPTPEELFKMPGVIAETFILLTSSFTSGLAVLAMHAGKRNQLIGWLAVTFVLGAAFITLEVTEFIDMVHEGATIATSGFLSGFFTLVGTHGLHVSIGLIWMIGLMIQLRRRGITNVTKRKVEVLSLYWHFLDVVWIFVLTVVYLMGVM